MQAGERAGKAQPGWRVNRRVGLLPFPESNATLGEIVGSQFNHDAISGQNTNVVFAHFAGNVSGHDVSVFELYPEHGVGQGLNDPTLHFYVVFFRHAWRFRFL